MSSSLPCPRTVAQSCPWERTRHCDCGRYSTVNRRRSSGRRAAGPDPANFPSTETADREGEEKNCKIVCEYLKIEPDFDFWDITRIAPSTFQLCLLFNNCWQFLKCVYRYRYRFCLKWWNIANQNRIWWYSPSETSIAWVLIKEQVLYIFMGPSFVQLMIFTSSVVIVFEYYLLITWYNIWRLLFLLGIFNF